MEAGFCLIIVAILVIKYGKGLSDMSWSNQITIATFVLCDKCVISLETKTSEGAMNKFPVALQQNGVTGSSIVKLP